MTGDEGGVVSTGSTDGARSTDGPRSTDGGGGKLKETERISAGPGGPGRGGPFGGGMVAQKANDFRPNA